MLSKLVFTFLLSVSTIHLSAQQTSSQGVLSLKNWDGESWVSSAGEWLWYPGKIIYSDQLEAYHGESSSLDLPHRFVGKDSIVGTLVLKVTDIPVGVDLGFKFDGSNHAARIFSRKLYLENQNEQWLSSELGVVDFLSSQMIVVHSHINFGFLLPDQRNLYIILQYAAPEGSGHETILLNPLFLNTKMKVSNEYLAILHRHRIVAFASILGLLLTITLYFRKIPRFLVSGVLVINISTLMMYLGWYGVNLLMESELKGQMIWGKIFLNAGPNLFLLGVLVSGTGLYESQKEKLLYCLHIFIILSSILFMLFAGPPAYNVNTIVGPLAIHGVIILSFLSFKLLIKLR